MSLSLRRAGPLDARPLAELISAARAQDAAPVSGAVSGAVSGTVTGADLRVWMQRPGAIWHLAEDGGGLPLGLQWVEPHPQHGERVARIASFTRPGSDRLRIGSALFEATCAACRAAGYAWIAAELRADNSGGLIFYQSRGFERWGWPSGRNARSGTEALHLRFEL